MMNGSQTRIVWSGIAKLRLAFALATCAEEERARRRGHCFLCGDRLVDQLVWLQHRRKFALAGRVGESRHRGRGEGGHVCNSRYSKKGEEYPYAKFPGTVRVVLIDVLMLRLVLPT